MHNQASKQNNNACRQDVPSAWRGWCQNWHKRWPTSEPTSEDGGSPPGTEDQGGPKEGDLRMRQSDHNNNNDNNNNNNNNNNNRRYRATTMNEKNAYNGRVKRTYRRRHANTCDPAIVMQSRTHAGSDGCRGKQTALWLCCTAHPSPPCLRKNYTEQRNPWRV